MRELPEAYQKEMRELLGEEVNDYFVSLEQPSLHGLRVNTSKISVDEFLRRFPYELTPVPWTDNGFIYNEKDPVTKHPYYAAGLYYVQEPSSMLPAAVMPVSPYDHVLDVCAAPGGKSTELGVKLDHTGVLLSNDISASRASALVKNIVHFGIGNAIVTAEDPVKLAVRFPHAFNRILIDAPCSGEGMFRREPSLITSWEKRGSSYYVPIQKQIVKACVEMLKEGGTIVYSTCTFSKCEDEEIIAYALSLDPDLQLVPVPYTQGFVQNEYGTKLFPHRIHGEGHFVSILQKGKYRKEVPCDQRKDAYQENGVHVSLQSGAFQKIRDRLYYVPQMDEIMDGLRILRSGLLLSEDKKKRTELNQALAFYMKSSECEQAVHLHVDDIRVQKYLRGETIDISEYGISEGWCLICVEEFPLGFAHVTHGVFKNKLERTYIQR